ncbi:MAG: ATP-binding protein [Armatimonadota bacterium]|nr:ATP-binding protein [Armatimonadota bacterium]
MLIRSFRWRLTATYLSLITILIAALGLYLLNLTERYYIHALTRELVGEATLAGQVVYKGFKAGYTPDQIADLAGELENGLTGRRVTIIDPSGRVLGDSDHNPKTMENHLSRPEVWRALHSNSAFSIRFSETLRVKMLYVAVSVPDRQSPKAVVRVAVPLSGIRDVQADIKRTFILAMIAALALAVIIGYRLTGQIASPISEMKAMAERIAGGDLSKRLRLSKRPKDEVFALAAALNDMAETLQRLVEQLSEEKGKVETVFDKLDDGVLTLDDRGRILTINPAAETFFGVKGSDLAGKTLMEGVLHTEMSELCERTLSSGEPGWLDITVTSPRERHLSAFCAPIADSRQPDQRQEGAVVVLHDLTEMKRLNRIRRDFVANVSHELRTPLATLRAMAETVVLRAKDSPDTGIEFANKIVDEVQRLTSITDELLDLAEMEEGKRQLATSRVPISLIVEQVLTQARPAAESKDLTLTATGGLDREVEVDAEAMVQALSNLVTNAINYTMPGGSVKIEVERTENAALISVIDTGIGISKADCERIFERFYRVDKARSRASGGTGLGLSIAKHIVELHEGRITVESELGKGSRFTIALRSV